jgi:hypothetical protein
MAKYEDLLKELEQVTVNAKEIIPKMCSCLKIEDPMLSNEEIRNRVKKDVIALGFRSDYVGHIIPKEYKDPIKAESGRKGAQTTNLLLKQGENVTQNVAAFEAATPEYTKVADEHTKDIQRFIKVKPSLYIKLRSVAIGAIRNRSPLIKIEYEGDQAKDVLALDYQNQS